MDALEALLSSYEDIVHRGVAHALGPRSKGSRLRTGQSVMDETYELAQCTAQLRAETEEQGQCFEQLLSQSQELFETIEHHRLAMVEHEAASVHVAALPEAGDMIEPALVLQQQQQRHRSGPKQPLHRWLRARNDEWQEPESRDQVVQLLHHASEAKGASPSPSSQGSRRRAPTATTTTRKPRQPSMHTAPDVQGRENEEEEEEEEVTVAAGMRHNRGTASADQNTSGDFDCLSIPDLDAMGISASTLATLSQLPAKSEPVALTAAAVSPLKPHHRRPPHSSRSSADVQRAPASPTATRSTRRVDASASMAPMSIHGTAKENVTASGATATSSFNTTSALNPTNTTTTTVNAVSTINTTSKRSTGTVDTSTSSSLSSSSSSCSPPTSSFEITQSQFDALPSWLSGQVTLAQANAALRLMTTQSGDSDQDAWTAEEMSERHGSKAIALVLIRLGRMRSKMLNGVNVFQLVTT